MIESEEEGDFIAEESTADAKCGRASFLQRKVRSESETDSKNARCIKPIPCNEVLGAYPQAILSEKLTGLGIPIAQPNVPTAMTEAISHSKQVRKMLTLASSSDKPLLVVKAGYAFK